MPVHNIGKNEYFYTCDRGHWKLISKTYETKEEAEAAEAKHDETQHPEY